MKTCLSRHVRSVVILVVIFAVPGYFLHRWQRLQTCEEISGLLAEAKYPSVPLAEMNPIAMVPDLIVIGVNAAIDDNEDRLARTEKVLNRIDPTWWKLASARQAIPRVLERRGGDPAHLRRLDLIDPDWRTSKEARDAIVPLVVQLTSVSSNETSWASAVLHEIDPSWKTSSEAMSAIPLVANRLLAAEQEVRANSLYRLLELAPQWQMREDAKPVVKRLVERLSDTDTLVRHDAAFTLQRMSAAPREAITALVLMLADSDHSDDYLLKIDPCWIESPEARRAIPRLINRYIRDGDDKLFKVLQRFGPRWPESEESRAAKDDWIEGLSSLNLTTRLNSIAVIERIGPDASAAVPRLCELVIQEFTPAQESYNHLRSYGGQINAGAARALGCMGPAANAAAPYLAIRLARETESQYFVDVKTTVLKALIQVGATAETLPELRRQLKARKNDRYWDGMVAEAIGTIGPAALVAVPELATMLESSNIRDRVGAASALGGIGPGAKETMPALIELLGYVRVLGGDDRNEIREVPNTERNFHTLSPDERITEEARHYSEMKPRRDLLVGKTLRETASKSLNRIDPEWRASVAAKKALARSIDHISQLSYQNLEHDVEMEENVLIFETEERIDARPQQLVALVAALDVLDPKWVESDAVRTIVQKQTVFLAAQVPEYSRFSEVHMAVYLLGEIGAPAREAIPHLVPLLAQSNSRLRGAVAWALGEMGSEARVASDALVQRLMDEDYAVTYAAAKSLDRIDADWPKTEGAAKALLQLMKDLNEEDSAYEKQARCARTIGLFKSSGSAAAPRLIQLLAAREIDIYQNSLWSLNQVDSAWKKSPRGQEAIPFLFFSLAAGRNSSLQILSEIEPCWQRTAAAREGIPFVIQRLLKEQLLQDKFAVQTLCDVDPEWRRSDAARQAIPELIKLLITADSHFEHRALSAKMDSIRHLLTEIDVDWRSSPPAQEAIPVLIEQLGNFDSQKIRDFAREMLDDIQPNWRESDVARQAVLTHLSQLSEPSRKAPYAALESIDPSWRKTEAARRMTPLWLKQLEHENPEYRELSAFALSNVGTGSPEEIRKLVEHIADESEDVSTTVFHAIEKLDPDWRLNRAAHKSIPRLDCQLQHQAERVRRYAAWALGQMGAEAKSAVPYLMTMLDDENPKVRFTVEDSLRRIDPQWNKTEEARPALLVFLKQIGDPSEDKRQRSLRAVLLIDEKGHKSESARQLIPHFIKQIDDKEPQQRIAAVWALGIVGDASEEVVKKLLECGTDDAIDDMSLSNAIHNADPGWADNAGAHQAIPHLIANLSGKNVFVRRRIVLYLWRMGVAAKGAIPVLIDCLVDEDPEVRVYAAEALATMGAAAKSAITALVGRLEDDDASVRASAAKGLGAMGRLADSAVPKLQQLRDDSHEKDRVRDAATKALQAINANKSSQ